MYDLQQRISYLKGLADGLDLKGDDIKRGKIISEILEILDDMADSILELDAAYSELDDYVECIDEDLVLLEEAMCTGEIDDTEFICPHCDETVDLAVQKLYGDEELRCPKCESVIYTTQYGDDVAVDTNIKE